MALNRKYAALPDLDSAPDIYETPELTDDNSTVPGTTVLSQSDEEFEEEDDDATGISRSRLRIDQARSRFMPANVDARDVDFSDRVSGKRKSYKTSTRRYRVLEDGTEEIGDLSDEDDEKNLERKLARLKREIAEVKEEYRRQEAGSKTQGASLANAEADLTTLSQVLEEMSNLGITRDHDLPGPRMVDGPRPAGPRPEAATGVAQSGSTSASGATYTITYAPTFEETHALAKTADFDARLVQLEQALGVGTAGFSGPENQAAAGAGAGADSSTSGIGVGGAGGLLTRALLPTLDALHRQISVLADASTSSLDSISRRVRALAQDADALAKARRQAKAAHDALTEAGIAAGGVGTGVASAEVGAAAGASAPSSTAVDGLPVTAEQAAKVTALYGMLPTIEALAPLLPPLLDRLRSLRAVHADAASAADALDRLERAQAEMAAEIAQWREGLDKVERAVERGEKSMAGNRDVVEGWVRELEARIAKLG